MKIYHRILSCIYEISNSLARHILVGHISYSPKFTEAEGN